MRLPQSFKNAVAAAAKSLNHSFKQIGVIHNTAAGTVSERNTLVHLSAGFLHAGFAAYATRESASHARPVDLIVSNRKVSFALTVHASEKILPGTIFKNAQTLMHYEPQAYPRLDSADPTAFWRESERWAALFVQSCAGESFNELWCSQTKAPALFEQNLSNYRELSNARKEDFSALAAFLLARDAHVGLEPICSELWRAGERLDLLWTAFPL